MSAVQFPPKAEARGSNPLGCAISPSQKTANRASDPCRFAQQKAGTNAETPYKSRTREATPKAQTWRNGSELYGDLADGPYAISPNRRSGTWTLFWADGETHEVATSADLDALKAVMRDLAERWRKRCRKVVYFIGSSLSVGHPVKIGHSNRVSCRLRQLQVSHHSKLQVFATIPGDASLEKRIHERYSSARLEGEWFKITPALKKFIERAGHASAA